MLIIGICGASGSGKSTLAENLKQAIRKSTLLLPQDHYYIDHSFLPFEERKKVNYDAPEAFDHALLRSDIATLKSGNPITKKGYDYTNHCRADSDESIFPQDVLILEGIHMFYDPALRDMMDLKLFMHVDADICLLRRVKRDMKERGRDIDGIEKQYLDTVKPMYNQYVRNYIDYADLIVAGGGRNKRIVDVLATYIHSGALEEA